MTEEPDGPDPGGSPAGAASPGRISSRRRVAVFRREFLKTSETFVRDHIRALRRYEPVVLTRRTVPGLEVPVDVVAPLESSARDRFLHRVGQRTQRVPHVGPRLTAIPMERALARLRPDVVHAHFGPDAELVRDACRRLGLPLVVTFHGYDVTVRPRELSALGQETARYARHRRRLFSEAAAVIAVSQFLAGRLVEQGAPPEKVTVIPAGVDTRRFEPTPPTLAGGAVFVGRLVAKKGCLDLLRAMALLPPEERREVVVVGDGPLRRDLEAAALDLGVPARFLGALDGDSVREQFRRSRFAVIPSRTAEDGDQEGLPVVALEAAAMGRAVVAAEHSGLPEAVVDGVTGLVYPEGSVTRLAAGLRRLSRDDALVADLGRAARREVEQRFDIRRLVGRVELVYDEVVEDAAPGSPQRAHQRERQQI